MSNLLSSLRLTSNTLRVFEQAVGVSQNNIANASTLGYAKQRLNLLADPFQPETGLDGGVSSAGIQGARNQYAEEAVRRQLESLGRFQQKADNLAGIEKTFDVSGQGGIPGALNDLFRSFSALSVNPNNTAARQDVLERARSVSQSFEQATASLTQASGNADQQLRQTVAQINGLTAKLREYNVQRRSGGQHDPGLDAAIHSTLEQLSELGNFTAVTQSDASITLLLGGQTPLVIGDNQYKISVDFSSPTVPPPIYPNATPPAHVLSSEGKDITQLISQGRLGGILEFRNTFLPSLLGDAYQVGDLNRLAKGLADRVNEILTSGRIADGPPPQAGIPLFTYDSTNDIAVAQTLKVNPNITPAQLATIDAGPPYASNGTALRLAQLASPQDNQDKIDGFSFTEFYGNLASRTGQALTEARDGQDLQKGLLSQARSLRGELSGVSLDEEAVLLVEFQRAYQANARLFSVLNDLTQEAVNLVR